MSDVKIPEDVIETARNVASAIHLKLNRAFVPEAGEEIIARALLAEREAVARRAEKCAAIYEDHAGLRNAGAASALRQFAYDVAPAIRSPHE